MVPLSLIVELSKSILWSKEEIYCLRQFSVKHERRNLSLRFSKETQDWVLKSKNGFCVSLLNILIQNHSDHGASKEPKNLLPAVFQRVGK